MQRRQVLFLVALLSVVIAVFVLDTPTWLRVVVMVAFAAFFSPAHLLETYGEYLERYERHKPPER